MKLLVTGGAGFIGSNFIRYILKKYPEYKIVNLDKLTYAGNLDNLKDICANKNYTFVKGDICDKALLNKLIKGCNIILNFAASTHVDRSIEDADSFIDTNINGVYTLLEAMRLKSGSTLRLFIQISTDEVYGNVLKGKADETGRLFPRSPYSASKAAAEHLAYSYFITYKLPVIISRSSNNFGPYQYPEKIIPLFVTNLLEGKKAPIYGDGENRREWIYAEDNCSALAVLMHKGKSGEIYNISAGNEITNNRLTSRILKIMGKSKNCIEYVKDRPGHDRRYALDVSKIKQLGWSPYHDFENALSLTIEWYKKNKTWWQKIKKAS